MQHETESYIALAPTIRASTACFLVYHLCKTWDNDAQAGKKYDM